MGQTARIVTEAKRCPGCSRSLAPEIRYRDQRYCGADTEVVLDNGQIVCLKCAALDGAAEPEE